MAQTQSELVGFFGMVALVCLIAFVVAQAGPPVVTSRGVPERIGPSKTWPDEVCELIGMEKTGTTRRRMIGRLHRIEHETIKKWDCDGEIVTAPRWVIWR